MSGTINVLTLPSSRVQLSDYVFPRYGASVPSGTTLEEIANPAYFRNVAHLLKQGAVISVLSDDFMLDVELRVVAVTKATVKTRLLRDSSAQETQVEMPENHDGKTVSWGGPNHLWRIMENGQVVDTGFATKAEAQEALGA